MDRLNEGRRAKGAPQNDLLVAVLHERPMISIFRKIAEKLDRSFPLFRYLVLQTQTHAFCGSLAFFALMAFYPVSSLLLYVTRYVLDWQSAYEVIVYALRDYYPTAQDFLVRNLEISVGEYGRSFDFGSVFWIILGAA